LAASSTLVRCRCCLNDLIMPARTRFYYFPVKAFAGNRLMKKGILPMKTISDIP
jgi:hypothetical protein